MITTKRDINLYWQSSRDLLPFLSYDEAWSKFPTFNITIYDRDTGKVIKHINNISSPDNARLAAKEDLEILKKFLINNSYAMYANTRSRNSIVNTSVQYNTYTLTLEENMKIYDENNNGGLGYYRNLSFYIYFYDEAQAQTVDIEYPEIIIDQIISDTFQKVNRSTDNTSIKFKINYEKFLEKDIKGFYLFPKGRYQDGSSVSLSSLFLENIETNWLSTVEATKILTIPMIETAIADDVDWIDLEAYVLNLHQVEIIKYLRSVNISNPAIDNFVRVYFLNQKITFIDLGKNSADTIVSTPSSDIQIQERLKDLKGQIDYIIKEIKDLKK